MKIFFTSFFLLFYCFSNPGIAQFEPIETDRPDQTESVSIVPKHWFQFEAGFDVAQTDEGVKQFLTPTLLSKYGLGKKIELRLITSFAITAIKSASDNVNVAGIVPVEIGSRIALFEEKKWRPAISFLFHFAIPKTASKDYDIENVAPNFRFAFQSSITDKLGIGYNLGAEWDGYDKVPAYIYTLSPGINFSKKCYGYIEAFGSIKKGESPENSFDGGFAYNLSNDCKVDISSGFGISPAAAKWYISLGISARFNAGKQKRRAVSKQ